jgi:hypothetical protein
MSTKEQEPVRGKANDSLTTRHIEQSTEMLRTLTTAHIQQKLGNADPIQNQGNAGATGSGAGTGQQQQGPADQNADKK